MHDLDMGSSFRSASSSDAFSDDITPATQTDTQSSQHSTPSGLVDKATDSSDVEEPSINGSAAKKDFASDIDGDTFAETYLSVVLIGVLGLVGFGGALSS